MFSKVPWHVHPCPRQSTVLHERILGSPVRDIAIFFEVELKLKIGLKKLEALKLLRLVVGQNILRP